MTTAEAPAACAVQHYHELRRLRNLIERCVFLAGAERDHSLVSLAS
jgi:hypothetical protein